MSTKRRLHEPFVVVSSLQGQAQQRKPKQRWIHGKRVDGVDIFEAETFRDAVGFRIVVERFSLGGFTTESAAVARDQLYHPEGRLVYAIAANGRSVCVTRRTIKVHDLLFGGSMSEESGEVQAAAEAAPEDPRPYICLVEVFGPEGKVSYIKFRSAEQAFADPVVPPSSRVWVSRAAFIGNSTLNNYKDFLDRLPAPEGGTDENWPTVRKGALYELLLHEALTPEQAAATLGVGKERRMAKQPKEPKAPKEPKGESERTYSRVDQTAKIKILAEKNPKREGSAAHGRFALYRNGMLVKTFLEKGGTTNDIAYDVKKGYIALEGGAEAA
jgi:hypothetical protein